MTTLTKKAGISMILSALALPLAAPVAAQDADDINVYGSRLSDGPEVEGMITNRDAQSITVTMENGQTTQIFVDEGTEVKATGGFLGLGTRTIAANRLVAGLRCRSQHRARPSVAPRSVRRRAWDRG